MKKYVIGILMAMALRCGVVSASEKCASCDGTMYFTGQTKTDRGKHVLHVQVSLGACLVDTGAVFDAAVGRQ